MGAFVAAEMTPHLWVSGAVPIRIGVPFPNRQLEIGNRFLFCMLPFAFCILLGASGENRRLLRRAHEVIFG
jgi:hypothetical protein